MRATAVHTLRRAAALALVLTASVASAAAQEAGDPARGRNVARQVCAECHAVLASETISPRPELPTFKVIANTPGMTGTAVAVWLRTPHKSMPNIMLPPQDVADLAAYIESMRDERR